MSAFSGGGQGPMGSQGGGGMYGGATGGSGNGFFQNMPSQLGNFLPQNPLAMQQAYNQQAPQGTIPQAALNGTQPMGNTNMMMPGYQQLLQMQQASNQQAPPGTIPQAALNGTQAMGNSGMNMPGYQQLLQMRDASNQQAPPGTIPQAALNGTQPVGNSGMNMPGFAQLQQMQQNYNAQAPATGLLGASGNPAHAAYYQARLQNPNMPQWNTLSPQQQQAYAPPSGGVSAFNGGHTWTMPGMPPPAGKGFTPSFRGYA